jgi:hypothetical protein
LLTIKYFYEDILMRTKAARGLVSTTSELARAGAALTVVIVTLVLMDGMAYAQTDKEDIGKRLAIIKEQCKKGFFSQKDCTDANKKLLEQLVSGGQGSQPPAKPTESQTDKQGEPAFVGTLSVVPISAQTLSIEGTYQLVSRTLPDGTVLKPPDIIGLLTYTKNHRNFTYVQKDATGKFDLVSSVATYTLTATEYSEKRLYGESITTNQIYGRDGVFYSPSGNTARTPVKIEGGRIQYKSLFRRGSQVFEGNKMTATDVGRSNQENGIIEVWKKVQ